MKNNFVKTIKNNENVFFDFMNFLFDHGKDLLLSGDVQDMYSQYLSENGNENKEVSRILSYIQEAIKFEHTIQIEERSKIGTSRFYTINLDGMYIEMVSPKDYLIAKEKVVTNGDTQDVLTLNFKPFYDQLPTIRDEKHIGTGVEYLNRFLSSQMFTDTEKWRNNILEFIKLHKYKEEQLLINDRITDIDHLVESLDIAIKKLNNYEKDTPFDKIKHDLQDIGFEKGLGKNISEILKTLKLLDSLMNSPDHESLAAFISRIPMIYNIVVVSSHGYFAQEGVLGKPDTGGQVVYILDQVKALEETLIDNLRTAGLDVVPKIIILTRMIPNAENTTCNKRLEKVHQTNNCHILRVPFREHNKHITDNWISRFQIYPYLEEFAEDSAVQLKAELGGRPDLIIGNYTDGNLVAYLLANKFNVTLACIAHALEKNKYLYSALYWDRMEEDYNFSLQFTSDLLAMNSADFVITSTYQEIAGTENSLGQYESYKHFTMPNLYRVENGITPFHTKFNIVSPGVNEQIFFHHNQKDRRIKAVTNTLEELLFENTEEQDVFGTLEHPEKLPIFSMARLDKNKNITAIVRWFGKSEKIREKCNLILVAGNVDANQSNDKEEIEEIHHMHQLIEEYGIQNSIRWIGRMFRKDQSGELYRIIADHKGIFVQPSLYEGFGLTVLEAMISGLPVFATKYGGPLEIVINGESGYHIDPAHDEKSITVLEKFIDKLEKNPYHWSEISEGGVKRVEEAYNWPLYSRRLLSLANIYGFWKFSSDIGTEGLRSYLDIIYHMLYKPRAKTLLERHNNS